MATVLQPRGAAGLACLTRSAVTAMTHSLVLDPSILAWQQQLVDRVVHLLDALSRVPGARLNWCGSDPGRVFGSAETSPAQRPAG